MVYRGFRWAATLTLIASWHAAVGTGVGAKNATTATPDDTGAGTTTTGAGMRSTAVGAKPADTRGSGAMSPPLPPLQPLQPPMSAAQVITVLDQAVDWYRTLGLQLQAANEPSDLLFLFDNRQTAGRVMTLAFDLARADAEMLQRMPQQTRPSGSDSANAPQALQQLQQKLDAQAAAIQGELDAERHPAAGASSKGKGNAKVEVDAKINELQGELDLVNTKRSILGTMTHFTAGTADADQSGAVALKAQIDAMAVAIPSSASAGGAPAAPAAATTAVPTAAPAAPAQTLTAVSGAASTVGRFGLWDLASNAFRLSEKAGTIASIDRRTAALQTTLAQVQKQLLDQIKLLSARGDALAAQADSADSTTLNGVREQLDALSAQFKQISSLLLPLSQEGVLLNQYRRNLANWQEAVKTQYRTALKTLGIRAGIVLVILALLFGAAELWRRTVVRYIQDTRRRYQLLLLRRIALWSTVVIVVGFAFASELGSIVTFAGLITAGIAVAMQSVLVSIVGYFFLIGKYGIRVGDRVQIGEVAGEVIDLGLVRMYLMELGAKGTMGPTGRVVAFANSVVFQVASGLFKQIPGVNFSWRESVLNLPSGVDYAAIKQRLLAAVTAELSEYQPEILRQTREIERTTLSTSAGDAEPHVQLHFSAAGVEAHVRYPVHLPHAAEIDERVTEALTKIITAAEAGAPAAT